MDANFTTMLPSNQITLDIMWVVIVFLFFSIVFISDRDKS
jgi:hypothetical protein